MRPDDPAQDTVAAHDAAGARDRVGAFVLTPRPDEARPAPADPETAALEAWRVAVREEDAAAQAAEMARALAHLARGEASSRHEDLERARLVTHEASEAVRRIVLADPHRRRPR